MTTDVHDPIRTLGPVQLRVPAEPSLSRVLRLAASGLASLTDFSVDEIEDIKIAVSEVLIALIEHGDLQPVEIEFRVDDAGFVVRGRTAVTEFLVDHPDLVLCRTVLAGVCAEHAIDLVDGHAEIRAVVLRGAVLPRS